MANQAIFSLEQEAAMKAGMRLPVQETGATTRATSATYALMGGLEIDAISTQSGNYTGVVGKLTCWTMAGEAANRDFVLPASAQVGERVGIYIVDGDPTDEILIKANDDTDKIGNTASFNTTEFTRLFIENECMIFRCVSAGAPDWIVEYDGRIPQQGILNRTTVATNYFTDGNWLAIPGNVAEVDIGDITDNSNYNFTFRRAGQYFVSGVIALDAVNTDDGCFCKIVSDPATAQNTKHLGLWQTAPSTTEYIASNAAGIVEITNSDLGTVTAVIAALGKYNNNTAGTAESGLSVCIQTATEIL